jgi:hypothetical protein
MNTYLALVSFKMASTADPMAEVAPMSTSSAVSWAWGARPIELWIEFNALHVSFERSFGGISLLSSLIPLLHEPSNNPRSGILPVESICQFLSTQVSWNVSLQPINLPRALESLLNLQRFQHDGIILRLERSQQSWNRSLVCRSRR